jgi:ATP-dependent helicase/nuclease subunit A
VLEAIGTGRLSFPLEGKDEARVTKAPASIHSVSSLVEGVDQGKDGRATLELYIENLLVAEERDIAEKDKLIALVDSILRSEFWQRVMRAERRYFEIPFSIKTTESELSARETGIKESNKIRRGNDLSSISDLPVILTGTIDLVFREDEEKGGDAGWIIADYKTDRTPGAEEIFKSEGPELTMDKIRRASPEFARVIDFYAPQIRLYTKFWSHITGERVKESGLYFTSLNRWINICEWIG